MISRADAGLLKSTVRALDPLPTRPRAMSPSNLITLATSNVMQRLGLAVAFLLLVAVLFVHNPTGGYEWQRYATVFERLPPKPECSMQRLDELSRPNARQTAEHIAEANRLTDLCFPGTSHEELQTLPFSQWQSREALLPWLARVVNLLWAAAAAVLAGVGLVWVFRPHATSAPSSSSP